MEQILNVLFSFKKILVSVCNTISGKLHRRGKAIFYSGSEKRRDTRYTIKAPASLTLETSPSVACVLFLHDISSGGALVSSTISIPQKEKVTLRTKLPFQQKWFGRDAVEFIFRGEVIRKEETGEIAIQFDDDYRISTALPG